DGAARARRGDGHRRDALRRRGRLAMPQRLRDLRAMAPALSAGHDAQPRTCVRPGSAGARTGAPASARAPAIRLVAMARGGRALLLVDQPRRDRAAACARARRVRMLTRAALCALALVACGMAQAQIMRIDTAPTPQPVLTV